MGERRELSARLTEMKRERCQTTSQSDMQELDRRRCGKLELAYTNIDQIGDSLLACSRLSCLQDMARKRTVETLTRVSSSVNGLNPCQAVPDISQLGPCVSAEVLRGRAFLLSTDKQSNVVETASATFSPSTDLTWRASKSSARSTTASPELDGDVRISLIDEDPQVYVHDLEHGVWSPGILPSMGAGVKRRRQNPTMALHPGQGRAVAAIAKTGRRAPSLRRTQLPKLHGGHLSCFAGCRKTTWPSA